MVTDGDVNAALGVTNAINALGEEPTADAVTAARSAYDALTDVQKKLVSDDTLNKLLAAEGKEPVNPPAPPVDEYQKGDVDRSGTVDVADIMKLKALIMADKWSDEELAIGDMDASKSLDVADIMAIKNVIMSM